MHDGDTWSGLRFRRGGGIFFLRVKGFFLVISIQSPYFLFTIVSVEGGGTTVTGGCSNGFEAATTVGHTASLWPTLTLEREAQRNRENNLCIEYSE